MATPIPSMPATDGALSYTTKVDFDTALANPAWTAVGLCTEWAIEPAKEHQLLYYGGLRRLANDKKIGEAYSLTFNLDLEAANGLPLYDRASKDIAGAGTAEEYLCFACRVKYDNVDNYFLLEACFISEVTVTIARDVLKASFSVVVFGNAELFDDIVDFNTATGVPTPESGTPNFVAPPAPDPLTHLSPGPGIIPFSVGGVDTGIISIAITHTNATQPIRCLNDLIASGGAIGHQSVRLTVTVYESTKDWWQKMKDDTSLNMQIKINSTKKIVMNGFKINGHPISHPQTSDDLGTIGLTMDGPSALLQNI